MILGVFWRRPFFVFFGAAKSRSRLYKNTVFFAPVLTLAIFGRPGGMRGAAREVRKAKRPLRDRQNTGFQVFRVGEGKSHKVRPSCGRGGRSLMRLSPGDDLKQMVCGVVGPWLCLCFVVLVVC